MKRHCIQLLLFFSVLAISLPASAGGDVEWRSWEQGIEEATENGKVLMLSVYTDWCGWCRRMNNDTYSNDDVVEDIHQNFVPVKLNPEEDKTYQLEGQEFSGSELLGMLTQGERFGYPTTLFLIVDERRIYMESGYQDADRFAKTLDNILEQERER